MRTLSLLTVILLSACSGETKPDDTSEPADADTDADTDSDTDADSDTDTDTDTDSDTDTDTDTDVDVWEWCPDPSTAVGDPTWEGRAAVTDDAVWCVRPEEYHSLEDAMARKAMLRVVEGDYPIPLEAGTADLGLPACLAFPDGTGLATGGGGSATTTRTAWGGLDYARIEWIEGVSGTAAGPWSIQTTLGLATDEGQPFEPITLGGGPADPYTSSGYEVLLHPNASGTWEADSRLFDACSADSWREDTHGVTFAGGEVELALQIGESAAGTEPSAFVRATGTLDGTAFDQRSYWHLAYTPEHHHWTRHFALRFDAPIGGACGLRVEGLTDGSEAEPTVTLTDCDLAALESRVVTAVSYTRGG